MSGPRILITGIQPIQNPDGSRLVPQGIFCRARPGEQVIVTVDYRHVAPHEAKPGESTGGGLNFIDTTTIHSTARTGLPITGQPVAVLLEPELTDWIDGSVKPTLPGWYERNYTPGNPDELVLYAYWSGRAWGLSRFKPDGNLDPQFEPESSIRCPWRGLRHDPTRGTGA